MLTVSGLASPSPLPTVRFQGTLSSLYNRLRPSTLRAQAARISQSGDVYVPRPTLSRTKTTDSMRNLVEIPMLDEHVGEDTKGLVRYLSPSEREQYRVRILNGRLCDAKGQPLGPTGDKKMAAYIYVINQRREIFAYPKRLDAILSHSSFFAGGKVTGAGELWIGSSHRVVVNNSSGHYKPSRQILDQTLAILEREGLDMRQVKPQYITH